MNNLARHIKQAHTDVEEVQISSRKITQRFAQIEAADLGEIEQPAALHLVDVRDDSSAG
jgi:DNA recombination protein RmuC